MFRGWATFVEFAEKINIGGLVLLVTLILTKRIGMTRLCHGNYVPVWDYSLLREHT
jgi:hypothetical protein